MGASWGARARTVDDERKASQRLARLAHVVYFVEDARGNIKIGRASDIYVRLAMIQTDNADPVTLLATIPGRGDEERAIHEQFASARIRERGEWFRGVPELRAFIASVAAAPRSPISPMQPSLFEAAAPS